MADVTYLRLSITDRCDMNCLYCRPSSRNIFFNDEDLLTVDEIERLAGLFVRAGVRHVRLTGGEPLVRPEFSEILARVASQKGVERLSLTTNGARLASQASLLRHCHCSANVSLDTLRRGRFTKLTGRDALGRVVGGIEAARRRDVPVKLNVLLIKGLNDDEIADFVLFGRDHACDVRFIEYFPTKRRDPGLAGRYVPSGAAFGRIEAAFGTPVPAQDDVLAGPARYYEWPGEPSRIGFISSVSENFCGACNRLRVTADGSLYPCLHADESVDLKTPLRAGDDREVEARIARFVVDKPRYNKFVCGREFDMSATGG